MVGKDWIYYGRKGRKEGRKEKESSVGMVWQ